MGFWSKLFKDANEKEIDKLKSTVEKINGFSVEFGKLVDAELKEKTAVCRTCLSLAETNPCSICSDPKRNRSCLCLVADTRDLLAIESTKQYHGLYYCLGGVINAIEGIKPENLNLKELLSRLNPPLVKEIILAFV